MCAAPVLTRVSLLFVLRRRPRHGLARHHLHRRGDDTETDVGVDGRHAAGHRTEYYESVH